MHIAFRVASDGLVSSLIRLRTGSRYTHCEIVISGGIGRSSDCFSASMQDGGVRRKNIILHGANWDLVPVHIDPRRLDRIIASETGKSYDTAGMIAWGTPFDDNLEHKDKWFCSEICAYALKMPRPWRYSPGSLHRALTSAV